MIALCWILPLAAVAAAALVRLTLFVQARRRDRMLAAMNGLRCDAPAGTGISLLCSGITDPDRIEELLSVGHARYEAVVVLDARRHPDLYAALVARFRLFRAAFRPQPGLPVTEVRSVGRSRLRRCRRLVLVDRPEGDPVQDLNAAASVASYDYLLPVPGTARLCADAIDRLVAELAAAPQPPLLLLSSPRGGVGLVARDAVVAGGGFSSDLVRSVPRRQRRTLYAPLFDCRQGAMPLFRDGALLWALAFSTLWFAATAATGMWPLAAVAATAALVAAAAECRRRILSFLS